MLVNEAANGRFLALALDYIQLTTATSINVNTDAETTIQWDTIDLQAGQSLSFDSTKSNTHIVAEVAGCYRLYANLLLTSAVADVNIRVRVRYNTTTILRSRWTTGYLSNRYGHNETSVAPYIPLIELNTGDYLEITTQREAAAGTVSLIAAQSIWFIERLDRRMI